MLPTSAVIRYLLAFFLLSSFPAFAQRPAPRLRGGITDTDRKVLAHSRTPLVQDAEDLGELSPETPVTGITLVFRRSAEQEATLKDLLAAQQDPASPRYHQWLTSEEFAAGFGATDEDIATTESWFKARGFHVDGVARSRDRITFSGTAAQVQFAFGTGLHRYRAEGEIHFAPAADLILPANLEAITADVLHLSDFRPKPSIAIDSRPRPAYTTAATQAHYLTPKDIATMYNLQPLYQKGFYGKGVGIAVVGQSYVSTLGGSKIQSFQIAVTGQSSFINPVLVPGSGVQAIVLGDQGESELDLEYTSGIARDADLFFVYVGSNRSYSVFDALTFAITQNIAPVVSVSYGACESVLSSTYLNQANALMEQAAAQGQTIVVSSGDTGSTTCAMYSSSSGLPATQLQSLSVSFPASSPLVTAVGGTQMAPGTFAAGSSPYWASAGPLDAVGTLQSYVPEVAWNEGNASQIAAGGGGVSIAYPRPAWQTGVPGIPSGGNRLVPDISLQSSFASPGFLFCASDPSLASCVNGLQSNNNRYTVAGGTSFAAPIFAGYLAILNNAQRSKGQGNINPVLYRLASNPTTYAGAFHDITVGSNGCVLGPANCSTAGATNYAATTGYDQATGLGSVDFNALATAWPADIPAKGSSTSLLVRVDSTANPGQTLPVFVNILPATGSPAGLAPTGTLSIDVDNTPMGAPVPLNAFSSAMYNFVAPTTVGSHLIRVTYSGDTNFSSSTATRAVMVGNVVASGGMSVAVANLTVANDGSGTTQVTVTPTGGYNGRVVWSLRVTGGTSSITACYGIGSLPVNSVSTAQLNIGVGAACTSTTASPRMAIPRGDGQALRRIGVPTTAVYATLLLCGIMARRRRLLPTSLLGLMLLTVASVGMIGCGGSNSAPSVTPTTPTTTATTYTLTLTGTDSMNTSITASTTFTLSVR